MKEFKFERVKKRNHSGLLLVSEDGRIHLQLYKHRCNITVYAKAEDEQPAMVMNNIWFKDWVGPDYDSGKFTDHMQYIGADKVGVGSNSAFLCGDLCILITEMEEGRIRIKVA